MTVAMIQALASSLFLIVGGVFAAVFMGLILVVFVKALKKTDLTDLFKNDNNAQMSITKFWSNVAYCAATIAFLAMNLLTPTGAGEVIWLIYLGIVASNAVAAKFINMKYGSGGTSDPRNPEVPPGPPVPVQAASVLPIVKEP